MKRRIRLAAALFPLVLLLMLAATARADLESDVRKVLTDKSLKSNKVGVEIIQLGDTPESAKTIFRHNADAQLIPASNLKLVTTAAALEILGRDFRFRTLLVIRASGDVAIIGDGDPTLGDAEMLRKVGWNVDTVFRGWAEGLKKRKITAVRNVYVDDGIFDDVFVNPSWPVEQQHKRYVAQVGGLNLNANCVDFFLTYTSPGEYVTYETDPATGYIDISNICVSGNENAVWLARDLGRNTVVLRGQTDSSNTWPISVTIHDPPMFAGTVLAESLRASGVQVRGEVLRDRSIRDAVLNGSPADAGEPWKALAVHETPIATVLARANKDSMNLYAEALCKRLGHAASGASGTWENGTAAIGAFLQSLGVKANEFYLDDGCGLSKKNTISANAIAKVLAHVFNSDNRQAFVESLSVAGSDGTLEKRFRGSDLQGRVHAKSGYVAGVSSLSGYVKSKDGTWYAFSILMNNTTDIATAKALQERIVTAIDRQAP